MSVCWGVSSDLLTQGRSSTSRSSVQQGTQRAPKKAASWEPAKIEEPRQSPTLIHTLSPTYYHPIIHQFNSYKLTLSQAAAGSSIFKDELHISPDSSICYASHRVSDNFWTTSSQGCEVEIDLMPKEPQVDITELLRIDLEEIQEISTCSLSWV